MTGFGFHAAPPAGHWINDPNGLIFADGRYRLFVQHRRDSPDYVVTGWARFSSDDLLHWEWDGEVLSSNAEGFAYSGSITATTPQGGAELEAWHTRHQPGAVPRERQFVSGSRDGGRTWSAPVGPFGPQGQNARDPYVFVHSGRRWMLVARPCDWGDAEGQSRIEMTFENAPGKWAPAVEIALSIGRGIMCEVPSLLCLGDQWALVASFIDGSGSEPKSYCGYWLGRFEHDRFVPDAGPPQLIDLGPDFYAAIPNVDADWPAHRMVIGWASSWATARTLTLGGGGSGGTIAQPRVIALADGVLVMSALPAAAHHGRSLRWDVAGSLTVKSAIADLVVDFEPGRLIAKRFGVGSWGWARDYRGHRIKHDALFFCDAGLVELFVGGLVMTVMVPGHNHIVEWRGAHD